MHYVKGVKNIIRRLIPSYIAPLPVCCTLVRK
jgi:hypothetical protein